MAPGEIIQSLSANHGVFDRLLTPVPEKVYNWRPSDTSWSILEIVCHLYDEEREDFRARTRLALKASKAGLRPINPVAWVEERAYSSSDYPKVVQDFLKEREASSLWLSSLERPNWQASFKHPELGQFSAHKMLANWLAHDYHHIRQINKVNYLYVLQHCGEDLSYAGNWKP